MINSTSKEHLHRGDTPLLRTVKESALLEIIREKGMITHLDIARKLNLSLSTIIRIVNHLIPTGQIIDWIGSDSSRGCLPSLLEYDFRFSLIISSYAGCT